MHPDRNLPIEDVRETLLKALEKSTRAVLVAPPGAGKTTRVPLFLQQADWLKDRRIIMLEPRRIAARAAATHMASELGEKPGQTVGYRVRLDNRTGPHTRIEIVTEGVFTRMILDDPELSNYGAVLFDEFHERSLEADFGLALALEAQGALRDDLRLIVMSATLDGARIASHMGSDTPVIESRGRAFDVELRHRPVAVNERLEDTMANSIRTLMSEHEGDVLAFLPGEAEIRRTIELLTGRLPQNTEAFALYGVLSPAEQDRAIRAAEPGTRKVVLATPIAESSLTIDGVRIVVDSGLRREALFEPALGLTRLVTRRISRASADQRSGRAGRQADGICVRLWPEAETRAMAAFSPPESAQADLSRLVLDCRNWGVADPNSLTWLDPLPQAHLRQAETDLHLLGALDEHGLTELGRKLGELPLPIRLAAMALKSSDFGRSSIMLACELATLLTERGLGGTSVDLQERLNRWRADRSSRAKQARALVNRLAGQIAPAGDGAADLSVGAMLSLGFPDRIAQKRGEAKGRIRFRMANGRGAEIEAHEPMARAAFLVVGDMTGRADSARIVSAAAIDKEEIRKLHGSAIRNHRILSLGDAASPVEGIEQEALGKVALGSHTLSISDIKAEAGALLLEKLPDFGLDVLPWPEAAINLRARIAYLTPEDENAAPDLSPEALMKDRDIWLAGLVAGCRSYSEIRPAGLHDALMAMLPWQWQSRLESDAPTHFLTPSGSKLPIDYRGEEPMVSCRPQMLFGLTRHPVIGRYAQPLLLELLSPAGRPIQTTRDLPGFWSGSWHDVVKDMRGRYPKHPWPDDPTAAEATNRAKPRK